MLVAISINKVGQTISMCEVFGRSLSYLIYNAENKSQEIISNPYSSELGGSGIQSAQFLIEKSIEVLITKDIGTNSLKLFKSANVKVYNCAGLTPIEALNSFSKSKLMLFDFISKNSFSTKKTRA